MSTADWLGALLGTVMGWRSRPGPVRRVFRRQTSQYRRPHSGSKAVTAASVQVRARLYTNGRTFASDMRRLALRAADAGADIIAFPEDIGTLLAGMIPGIERQASKVGTADAASGVSVAELFRFLARGAWPVYHETFSGIASETGAYVFAGSIIVPGDDGQVYNRAHVFAPNGVILGWQDKTHLFPSPIENGLKSGERLNCIDLPFCRAAVPICMDATYFETFRILAAEGVELVVIPIANPEEYNYWYALRGIWPRVQENRLFGIKSALVGDLLGMHLTGVSGIYAPLALTPGCDGVLAEASSCDTEDVVVATLDFAALREYARNEPLDLRPQIYARYLPALYGSERTS